MPVYLDCNATTQVEAPVADLVFKLMREEYGNAGSRTHGFGTSAKKHVEVARGQVASVTDDDKASVIFTSGATESNNIALLGLENYAKENNKNHIITTEIEHKSVLEPIQELQKRGFEVTYLPASEDGLVTSNALKNALREDTFLVSIMHINNETGSIQPIAEFCSVLAGHDAYFHVDAAQSFGKYSEALKNDRIDLISASGHKLYAPKGIGALIQRKRGFFKVPLKPIIFGGGQERSLRPGTLAVPLIAGFGLACELAVKNVTVRTEHAKKIKKDVVDFLQQFNADINGESTSDYVVNFSIPEVNSEAAMVVFKDIVAVSNGSACTSNSYTPSHVLVSMGLNENRINGAIRMSWSHQTESVPFAQLSEKIEQLL